MPTNNDEWMSLAQQVSVEMDHAKLAILVGRLCQAIDDRGRLGANRNKREIEPIVGASCPTVACSS
jgi:hypothetical protein